MDYKYVWNIIRRQHLHEIKMIIHVLNINNLISGLSFLALSIWRHNQKLSRYARHSYVIPWPSASKWQNFILSLSLHNLDETCVFYSVAKLLKSLRSFVFLLFLTLLSTSYPRCPVTSPGSFMSLNLKTINCSALLVMRMETFMKPT